jgi:hypothetical protein
MLSTEIVSFPRRAMKPYRCSGAEGRQATAASDARRKGRD